MVAKGTIKPLQEAPLLKTDPQKHWNEVFDLIDKFFQANLAKLTLGISPAAIDTSIFSWGIQLSQAPGRLQELTYYPLIHGTDMLERMYRYAKPADGKDVRFHSENWQDFPWRVYAETFLLVEGWWRRATRHVPGLPRHVERTVTFMVRQALDALSPSNFVLTNPDLFQETIRSDGMNLVRGSEIAIEDFIERLSGAVPQGVDQFLPGKTVAVTKGRVVFKNHLIELIQYAPTTNNVYKEPILIIPAWIMKYYILDLSPQNSLVKFLVDQGFTVFMISWRNPDSADRNLNLDDYYRLGAMAAINIVTKRCKAKLHIIGYCLGGTLAMLTASAMANKHDNRLKSLSLLAAQGDFTDAGELMLFVTESQVPFLENMMWDQGYLDTKQMAGSFQMLRSYDLIWSKMVQDYMHGKRRSMIDLLAWNADATRMPYKMHSEYLEKLFLRNDFAAGRFTIEGECVLPENIRLPSFIVSTEKDHVAPWQSVYKTTYMTRGDVTFVLTNGGHNAGIISEPNHADRYYRIGHHKHGTTYLGPAEWLKSTKIVTGSWWFALQKWLRQRSTDKVPARNLSKNLPKAPGSYVLQK